MKKKIKRKRKNETKDNLVYDKFNIRSEIEIIQKDVCKNTNILGDILILVSITLIFLFLLFIYMYIQGFN